MRCAAAALICLGLVNCDETRDRDLVPSARPQRSAAEREPQAPLERAETRCRTEGGTECRPTPGRAWGGPAARSADEGGQPHATTTSTTAPTSRAAEPPAIRRGLWIWDFAKNAPPPERAATLARDAGFHRVFIKAAEGAPDTIPRSERWARNFSDENVAPFLRAGLEVWAFGYFYPDHFRGPTGVDWGALEDQVDVAVRNAARPGVVGIVVDAEAEFYDRGADAARLCKLLRARFPGKVAYTSFGWLSAHRRFPFKAFDEGCSDAFLPQVYSTFGWPGGVTTSMQRLARDAAALELSAPMWPIQSIERAPPPDEIARFFGIAGPDASLFHLQKEGEPSTLGLLEWSRRAAPAPASIAAD